MPQFRLFSSVVSLILFNVVLGCPVIVEKGQPASLECSFPNTVRAVTWRLAGSTAALTTCQFDTNNCNDLNSRQYEGTVTSSSTRYITRLNIKRSTINATEFECVPDVGKKGNPCELEIYAWPQKPVCRKNVTETYVEITCTTSNAYPELHYEINRKEAEITDIFPGYPKCTAGKAGSGSDGDATASCTFRFPMADMRVNNTFYIEMSATVPSGNITGKTPSVSDDVTVTLSVPKVTVYIANCTFWDEAIKIGSNATCRCDLIFPGFPPGRARWYNKYNRVVGDENSVDGSSTLTVSYNESDPNQAYMCFPATPIHGTVRFFRFNPKFTSCPVIVEKGQPASIECSFPNTVRSVTWRLAGTTVALTTCGFDTNKCNNINSQYEGTVTSSSSGNITRLNIKRATTSATEFECVPDVGKNGNPCELEVYAWPQKPVCRKNVTETYVEITCTTSNVYPILHYEIHRREAKMKYILSGYPECIPGEAGSGSDGDYTALCTWRFPMADMRVKNSFYTEMSAAVPSGNITGKTPSVSDDVTVSLSVPEVFLYAINCPVGPGVGGSNIQIGTNATCRCDLTSPGFPPGHASWYDKYDRIVGDKNSVDGSSTLTMSYNESDPNQVYRCIPKTPINGTFIYYRYIPVFTSCFLSVEKGQRASLECSFPNNVSSVSWKMMNRSVPIDLVTCSYKDNNCSSLYPTQYQASVSTTATGKVSRLDITSARTNETRFTCLTDNGMQVDPCALEVYVKPKKPTCQRGYVWQSSNFYLQYNCSTENVYPMANAVLHRRELEITADDFAPGYPRCYLNYTILNDRTFGCEWLIPIQRVISVSTIYVEMTSKVSNATLAGKTDVFSEDLIEIISIPQANLKYCPLSPRILDNSNRIATEVTCTCEIISKSVYLNDYARWLDKDNKTVGIEQSDGSSVLHITYNKSDPHPTYTCWPITKMRADVQPVIYRPKFTSTAPRCFVVNLQTFLVVLGAVCSTLVF